MSQLLQKKILLAITGSIAAYKSAELIRLLRCQGAEVKVVMTQDAEAFITALTAQALSGQPVYTALLDAASEASMSHITLARWADLLLVAPATANVMAKFAAGLADDLLSTLYLACAGPVVLVPAMNQHMWQHPATCRNKEKLAERGHLIWGPSSGQQACGDVGPGRMLEPTSIIAQLKTFFSPQLLAGLNILITAGPTREPIDPVRYSSNYSSGKMGYALAKVAAELSGEVTLISGPTQLTPPAQTRLVRVETAQEMHTAVMANIDCCDIFIAAAAVADYRCKEISAHKIKKSAEPVITWEKNVDILAAVSALAYPPFLVGFAAETENLLLHAKDKLIKKKLNIIVANQVGVHNAGFNSDFNQVSILTATEQIDLPYASKQELAAAMMPLIFSCYRGAGRVIR